MKVRYPVDEEATDEFVIDRQDTPDDEDSEVLCEVKTRITMVTSLAVVCGEPLTAAVNTSAKTTAMLSNGEGSAAP